MLNVKGPQIQILTRLVAISPVVSSPNGQPRAGSMPPLGQRTLRSHVRTFGASAGDGRRMAEVGGVGLGRILDEVDSDHHDPAPVDDDEAALDESGISRTVVDRSNGAKAWVSATHGMFVMFRR
jgi:hypothetical protein